MLDMTFLDMTAEEGAFDQFLREGIGLAPAALCVQPCRVGQTASAVELCGTGVASVVGFPAGGSTAAIKAAEARQAVEDGATELDMVVNLAQVRKRCKSAVLEEVSRVVEAGRGVTVKVIVEAPLLSADEKHLVCEAIVEGKAHFIKTCTGFASNWADAQDIHLFRELLPQDVSIKASGKIGTFERVAELYAVGARRFGVLVSQARDILGQCGN